jgi:hypothetical protein
MIYTTNSIESLNSRLRRSVRTRGHFPNDEAATKLISRNHQELENAGSRMACGKTPIRFGVRRSVRGKSLTHRLRTHKIPDRLSRPRVDRQRDPAALP